MEKHNTGFFLQIVMNVQRKRITQVNISTTELEVATVVAGMVFQDSAAVNVHGVNITLGVTAGGDDEIALGRWYVVALPRSIVSDGATFNTWISLLNTITSVNNSFESTEFIWGAGSFVVNTNSAFNLEFSSKTSRNMQEGLALFTIVAMDDVTGLVDTWDAASTISAFTSS